MSAAVYPHMLDSRLLTRRVKVLLVGAGGTGSRMLEKLANLHRALLAKGHPGGFHVTVVDPDTVSSSNIGRQAFYPGDIGAYKADVLVNRINMSLGNTEWVSATCRLDTKAQIPEVDMVIGAVDNRAARLAILRTLENSGAGTRYWLDTGNKADTGQVVLGEVITRKRKTESVSRLPHIAEFYPEIIDPSTEQEDDTPSCSLAEALDKQSLFINTTVSDFAGNLLWQLFTQGGLDTQGVFINLKRSMVTPLRIDPEVWSRFGIQRDGVRRKIESPKTKKKEK